MSFGKLEWQALIHLLISMNLLMLSESMDFDEVTREVDEETRYLPSPPGQFFSYPVASNHNQ